jgi:nucleotide-binding universal stress UspA family protein
MAEWKKILCAVDFSDVSRAALAEAAALARRLDAALALVHVYEPPPPVALDVVVPTEGLLESASSDVEARLEAWTDDAQALAGRPVRAIVRIGAAAAELVRCAAQEGADVLVLGTHGRTGLKHLVLGSVAERVLREAACPVLVVRDGGRSEAAAIAAEVAQYRG